MKQEMISFQSLLLKYGTKIAQLKPFKMCRQKAVLCGMDYPIALPCSENIESDDRNIQRAIGKFGRKSRLMKQYKGKRYNDPDDIVAMFPWKKWELYKLLKNDFLLNYYWNKIRGKRSRINLSVPQIDKR